jgi:hypothetical protein
LTVYCSKHCIRPILGSCSDCNKLREQEQKRKEQECKLREKEHRKVCSAQTRMRWWQFLRRTSSRGLRILPEVVGIVAGIYLALYTAMLARHELRLNRATYERSAFIDLVTSNNRGAFIAAMQNFGPVQTIEVPPEPAIWPPWRLRNWWGESNQPNMDPLRTWAQRVFPECTSITCGRPNMFAISTMKKSLPSADLDVDDLLALGHPLFGIRIDLSGANLRGADIGGVGFSGVALTGADLRGTNLSNVKNYEPSQFTSAFWDDRTTWPEKFTPPCPQNTRDHPCHLNK